MLTSTEIKAHQLIIEQIDKVVEKLQKRADKEILKKNSAYVTYKGEKYYSESDLEAAYACDEFSSSTYDRLLDKLNKAKGIDDFNAMTPTQSLISAIEVIKENLYTDIRIDEQEKKRHEWQQSRAEQLANEGHSVREIEEIIFNERPIRF